MTGNSKKERRLRFSLAGLFSGFLFVASLFNWALSLWFPAVALKDTNSIYGIECLIIGMGMALQISPAGPHRQGVANLSILALVLHVALLLAVISRMPKLSGLRKNPFRIFLATILLVGSGWFYWLGTSEFRLTLGGYRLWLSSFQLMAFALLMKSDHPK